MVGALWTGISGLSGAQTALDNESNNIANVNTVGYKASRISFADQMYQDHIGKGVSSYAVEKLYTQGNLKVTGVNYDMALSGDGFFLVNDGSEDYFTRAGNFRMGDPGNLQTAGGLAVQGWAMQDLQDEDIQSSDNNAKQFTNDYSKLLGNQVITGDNDIKTITAKATDYTKTAISDNKDLYAGAGQKSASTKISDVELLVTKYNQELLTYANENPKPTATASKVQRDMVDFHFTPDDGDDTTHTDEDLDTGDEIYAWVDGIKYSQSFDTDDQTTMKLLVNKLSNIPGVKAYITDGAPDYKLNTQDETGKVVIESIIPGKQLRVTEVGQVDASNGNGVTKGTLKTFQEASQGTGLGAIKSAQIAMSKAISGKQEDVFTPVELGNAADLQYSISIYDKDLKKDIMVPNNGSDTDTAVPLDLGATSDPAATSSEIDEIVSKINGTVSPSGIDNTANDTTTDDYQLSDYVKAYNINGNLVIKTKDFNYDVEYTSDMKDAGATPAKDIARDPNLSGREGAGAECLALTTTINQTATKNDLQLRLDTLGITDSAFGDFSVDSSGVITMKQDGASYAIGQIAVAKFTDNRGLEPSGDNLVKASNRSGKAIYNLNNDKTAELRGGTLELSNSDLSESLVNLMVFQRAFEANSKTISTADQILTTLIQLKR